MWKIAVAVMLLHKMYVEWYKGWKNSRADK